MLLLFSSLIILHYWLNFFNPKFKLRKRVEERRGEKRGSQNRVWRNVRYLKNVVINYSALTWIWSGVEEEIVRIISDRSLRKLKTELSEVWSKAADPPSKDREEERGTKREPHSQMAMLFSHLRRNRPTSGGCPLINGNLTAGTHSAAHLHYRTSLLVPNSGAVTHLSCLGKHIQLNRHVIVIHLRIFFFPQNSMRVEYIS